MFVVTQPCGDATNIGFSEVEEKLGYAIFAYVPQISLPQFEYPLLACDISEIDQNLIGWEDSANGMNAHNLIYDIPGLADAKEPPFSLVKQWKVEAKEKETTNDEKDTDAGEEPKVDEGPVAGEDAEVEPKAEAKDASYKNAKDPEEEMDVDDGSIST